MSTTLDIDDPVLKDLKRLQKRQGKSLGRLVSDLLAQALAHTRVEDDKTPPFSWVSHPHGRPHRPTRQARPARCDGRREAMSFGVDVNILLYASDAGSPQHAKAHAFLNQCAQQRQVFCLAWMTLMSYLRMSTHPSVFTRPLQPDEAMRNIDALLRLPHCRVITEDEGFWSSYRELTSVVPTRGNLVPDAHLAAILLRNGVTTLYTHDRDFRKVPVPGCARPVGLRLRYRRRGSSSGSALSAGLRRHQARC